MSVEMLNPEEAFELKTIRQDMVGDALFLIGTLISIDRNKKDEQKIICPEESRASGTDSVSMDNEPIGLGIIVLMLFLIATAIFALTATERLNKQKAEAGNNPNQTTVNNIRGGETVILGQLIRIIGYSISIMGEKIKAANPV